jgi:type I restriction enzyme S subunit
MATSREHHNILMWSEVEKWTPTASLLRFRDIPQSWRLIRVADLVTQIGEKHRVESGREYRLAGVKWYGAGVFHRESVKGKDSSAIWLSPLVPGALIYNRLFAWKESFAIVPDDLAGYYVSNEFPQFKVNEDEVIPEYLYLVFNTEKLIRAVNAASIGSSAVSRNRLKEEDFLDFTIPLPPRSVQRKIVEHWYRTQNDITAAIQRARQITNRASQQFMRDLGLESPMSMNHPKCFLAKWSDFDRWSVSYNQTARSMVDLTRGKYRVVELGSILTMVQYGTSEKANTSGQGVPVIRMNNIVEGRLDLSDLKHVKLPEKVEKALALTDGDILFNRTNSKELVGKCAVFHERDRYVFASYLIRVRVDEKHALPDYLSFLINCPVGRKQIDALSRQIIGQANINSEELRSLQVPLPRLKIQREIMKRVERGLEEAQRQQQLAESIRFTERQNIEQMILGTRSVEGI